MVVTGRTVTSNGVRVAGRMNPVMPGLDALAPLIVAMAVLAGMTLALAMSPIGSGDYGQWLMTSRLFLGEAVPAYRDLASVPWVVPLALAGIRTVVADPLAALHVLAAVLLVLLGASLFVLGTVTLRSRWGGTLSVVVGLLVTDRFTDLFAFGGLLQVAAVAFGSFAVAALIRAARGPLTASRWWSLAAAALALAALTHVGTALILVPIGIVLAASVGLLAMAQSGWDPEAVLRRLRLPAVGFALIGAYWLLMLLPASGDYVTNPASLAYRGPDRLWADLFGRWPTAVVIVVGATALALAAIRSAFLRRIDGPLLVALWAVLAWSALGWSLAAGSATDFPRFATPLVTPLIVGAAAAVLWSLRTLAASLAEAGWRGPPSLVIGGAVVLAVLVAAPLTIERHVRQADFYELRNAEALMAASAWLERELPADAAVLADVREGKWIEGLSGRPALFSQAVRYAFRPAEWQRSAEADALLRSTVTLTSGYVAAQFTGRAIAQPDGEPVPTGLVIRANHGGEFADLLRIQPSAVTVDETSGAALVPLRSTELLDERQASMRTVWAIPGAASDTLTQTVTTFIEGTTLRLVQAAPGHRVTTELAPAFGMAITSLEVRGTEAKACFTELAGSNPCVRLRTTAGGGSLLATPDGIRVTSGGSGRIELLITALTAGNASIGLGILRPDELVATHDVRAALLYEPDPAYAARVRRLAALGFEEAEAFGPYRVLVRGAETSR